MMMHIESETLDILSKAGIKVDRIKKDNLFLKSVPLKENCFNKEKANILLYNQKNLNQYLVFSDADLQYCGPLDPSLLNIFNSQESKDGWKPLRFNISGTNINSTIFQVLGIIAKNNILPQSKNEDEKSKGIKTINEYITDITSIIHGDYFTSTIGRKKEMELAIITLFKWDHPKLPLLVGSCGVGKTNLAFSIAKNLIAGNSQQVFKINLSLALAGYIFQSQKETKIIEIFNDLKKYKNTLFLIENFDLLVRSCPYGLIILREMLSSDLKIIGIMDSGNLNIMEEVEINRYLQIIPLKEPDTEFTLQILQGNKNRIEKHHAVKIQPQALEICLSCASDLSGKNPAKTLNLLDVACSRTRYNNAIIVAPDDIVSASTFLKEI